MRRLLALLCFLGLVFSISAGSLAHAAEPVGCLDTVEASLLGHSASDADQVPGDAEKGYPHHHGGCQDHFVGMPVADDADLSPLELANALAPSRPAALHPVDRNSLRRPPRA
jgi:hypothetical protein